MYAIVHENALIVNYFSLIDSQFVSCMDIIFWKLLEYLKKIYVLANNKLCITIISTLLYYTRIDG